MFLAQFAGKRRHAVRLQCAAEHYYDPLPDGSILGVMPEGANNALLADRIIVVQNWFEELKRLVPVEQ